VESLTDEIEKRARELIGKVEQMGGVVAAIEQGFMQNEIADSAYKYQQAVEAKQRIVVGVNKYEEGVKGSRGQGVRCEGKEEPGLKLLKVDPALGDRRAAELSVFRKKREAPEVAAALTALKDRARGTGNLMDAIVTAVRTGGTVGEISDALRAEFGEHDRMR
jgi:methylmalonyl-CoA mutase N-terminal domain/subunit